MLTPMLVMALSVTEVRRVHPLNTVDPIVIVGDDIMTDVKNVHPLNALVFSVVTVEGIVIDVKPVHPKNALVPIVTTVEGIVIDVSPVQPLNALVPMLVIAALILIDVNVVLFVATPPRAVTATPPIVGGMIKMAGRVPVVAVIEPDENVNEYCLIVPGHPEFVAAVVQVARVAALVIIK